METLPDVVERGLCCGCGACVYACEDGTVSTGYSTEDGYRPRFHRTQHPSYTQWLPVCPGYRVDGDGLTACLPKQTLADHLFGPTRGIWEGHAEDPKIRFAASSGGILSAISLYCLDHEQMGFVLHTGMSDRRPLRNRTVISRTRDEIIARAGSRYGSSAPCEGLKWIEQAQRPCVFIGRPCDSSAVFELRRRRPGLDRNLGLVLSFFCAGAPTPEGLFALLEDLDVDPNDVGSIRYRGKGWPGDFVVTSVDGSTRSRLSYRQSWSKLSGYRTWRCKVCPDGLGRLADITCGDAWDKLTDDGDPGRSIVISRTERGTQFVERAAAARYVRVRRIDPHDVLSAQRNLLQRHMEAYGRLLAMQALLVPTPAFPGFSLKYNWRRLGLGIRARVMVGTGRRLLRDGVYRRKASRRAPSSGEIEAE